MPFTSFAEFALQLDDNVLQDILDAYLYREDQFADDLEHDTAQPGSPFAQRYRTMALAIIPASRRLRYLGQRVLWKSILLRSAKNLKDVARQSKGGQVIYGGDATMENITRRLEVRFAGAFKLKLLKQLVRRLGALEVVVFRDHSSQSHVDLNADQLLHSLCRVNSRLRRLQLESDYVVAPCASVLKFLDVNPQVRTVRVAHMPFVQEEDRRWVPSSTTSRSYNLSILSLGSLFLREPLEPDNPFDLLQSTLVTTFPRLHRLTELELYEVTPAHIHLLETYGHQLRRILYAPTGIYGEHGEENGRSWADLCPNLKELHWLICGPYIERPPIEHPTISKVTVEYYKNAFESRWECTDRVEDAVDTFRYGDYERVNEIEVIVRGMMLPDVSDFDWTGMGAEVMGATQLEDGDGWAVTVARNAG